VNLVVEPAEPAPKPLANLGVECSEGFVQQQHLGLDGQRPGEGDPLPLAPGELPGVAALERFKLDQPEQLAHAGVDFGLRRAARLGADPQPKGNILEDGHVPEQGVVLEHEADPPAADGLAGHVLAVEKDRAVVGEVKRFQPGDDPQERRFPRARRPQQGDQLSVRDVQRHAVQREEVAKTLADVADLDAHRSASAAAAVGGVKASSDSPCVRHSTSAFKTSVSSASIASSEATANAATKLYSL